MGGVLWQLAPISKMFEELSHLHQCTLSLSCTKGHFYITGYTVICASAFKRRYFRNWDCVQISIIEDQVLNLQNPISLS